MLACDNCHLCKLNLICYEWVKCCSCHVSMVVSVWQHFLAHPTTHWILKSPREFSKCNTCDNGHFWSNYHDAHFEHPHLNFCKLSIMIFLHGLQDHIKVNNFVLANLAETLSFAYFKNPKWQSMNGNKINPHFDFQQTTSLWPTKNTQRCIIIWAPHPNFVLPKFQF